MDDQQKDAFRLVVEAVPTAIILVNAQGLIEIANSETERIFDYTRAELENRPVEMLIPERLRGGHPAHRQGFAAAPATRAMGTGRELKGRRRDGSEFPVEIGLNPLLWPQKPKVLAAITDISERVETIRRLAEHREELERSNAELSTFAFVASHDLKSPLRGISQLSNWIEEDIGEGNYAAIPGQLNTLRGRIRRMENLLDDLLAYSRVGRVEGVLRQVSLADLARSVFELQAPPPGIALELPEALPEITTLVTPLEQVVRNLFSNAIKHHDRPQGVISLRLAAPPGGFWTFQVADDGPGIPPQYHERVFQMFQTLRPRDEVEGSGMGLAFVKKIVETYGGTVSINPEEGRGCCISFTWPKNIERRYGHERASTP
ncbi:sensor histidine kinase [Azorhizobium doebereinerae]|uniref:sensor histidine kinase n=1 Tax=Azorhizobium doebereinerae TaxID=281091 RepID=UPI000405DDC1|nr:PAS domain-containing sensor histidine kinase [Azorhizobium doebereinerae]